MKTAYDGSAIAKKMFDDWIATAGNTIKIDFLAGNFQAYANMGRLEIDLAYLTNANYINNTGKAVQDTAVTAIVHELVHALTGRLDDGNYTTNYKGATVTFSNTIYKELGLDEQNSYIAYDSTGNILTRNFQYTNGAAIDRSESGDRDWNSSAAGNSKDLLIGGASANNLQSGDGNDFLFGAGGNDMLNGGNGTDTAVLTGRPTDYDVRLNANGTWTSRHVRGAHNEGNDTFTNLERVQFEGGQTFNLARNGLTFQTDFAFVIDTTGSMFDDIDAVKASAAGIVNALFAGNTIDARIGIVGFKDNTIGEPTSVILPFTDHDAFADRKTAALAAINSIGVGGGGDFPETAFDGLLKALDGTMGDWRVGAGTKKIALFTDATAKDAFLLPAVLAYALNVGAVITGRSSEALGTFGTVDTFALALADDGQRSGRDPVSEGDALPPFVPSDDPVMPPGGTATVQVFTIFIEGFTAVDTNLESLSASSGGGVLTAASPSEVVDRLLEVITSANYQLAVDTATILEGDTGTTDVTFTLTRDRADNASVVTIATTGTADSADVTGAPASVSFAIGETAKQVTVSVIGDTVVEADETFGLQITAINEPSSFPSAAVEVTILNDDTSTATPGNDSIDGTGGDDSILALAGNDTVRGFGGDDTLIGNDGADYLDGAGGNDSLVGGVGDDRLRGGGNDDNLRGDGGEDDLIGGKGNDTLVGGLNADTLTGGDGADRFYLHPDDRLITVGDAPDVITDFSMAEGDRINLVKLHIADFATLEGLFSPSGADTLIDLSAVGGRDVLVKGVSLADLDQAQNFVL